MSIEGKSTFFRQSGWLIVANTLAGLFMVGVHPFASKLLPPGEYGLFVAFLRLFTVLAIPAAGLQIVFAQRTAAAVTPQKQADLWAGCRRVAEALVILWLGIALVFGIFQKPIVERFNISNPVALWVTLILVLAALLLPLLQGILQGQESFLWLGASMVAHGFGRCAFVILFLVMFHGYSTGAISGTLCGVFAALAVALVGLGGLGQGSTGNFKWRDWLKQLVPLTLGTGSVLFLLNVDVIAVQSNFPKEVTAFYSAGAMVGVGLVTFTTPIAAVMFPKLVRSIAQQKASNALTLALMGTAVMGCAAALIFTFWPTLPLRIMYFRNPEYLNSSVLVPWFMWCLLPVTLANVLVSNLLAREQFAVVPWLVTISALYGVVIFNVAAKEGKAGDPFRGFQHIIQTLGLFSTIVLSTAAWFNYRLARSQLVSSRGAQS